MYAYVCINMRRTHIYNYRREMINFFEVYLSLGKTYITCFFGLVQVYKKKVHIVHICVYVHAYIYAYCEL